MWLWGGDFEFQDSVAMFSSMDQIVKHIQQNSAQYAQQFNFGKNMTIKYSRVSDYIDAVNQANLTWSLYEDGIH